MKKLDTFRGKGIYDSLKLAKIYQLPNIENWDRDDIMVHEKDMIDLLKAHYA